MASLYSAQAYCAFATECLERAHTTDSFVDQLYLLQRAEAWRRQAKVRDNPGVPRFGLSHAGRLSMFSTVARSVKRAERG